MPPDPPVSLREYLESRLDEKDRRDQQRFDAQEKANINALVATKEALSIALSAAGSASSAAMEANKVLAAKAEEFADQKLQTHNAIRPWVESLVAAQAERISMVERRVSRFEHREEGMGMTTKIIIGAVGFFITLLGGLATAAGLYFAFSK